MLGIKEIELKSPIKEFELVTPASLEEALKTIAEAKNFKVLAGGTGLLLEMRRGAEYSLLVDIKKVPGLSGITKTADGRLEIGALTTHSEILNDTYVREKYPAMVEKIKEVASVQTRIRGTIGGRVCSAAAAGESLGDLTEYDAVFVLRSKDGERRISAKALFAKAPDTAIRENELLTQIILPTGK